MSGEKITEVRDGCGGTCRITIARSDNINNDLTIRSVTKVQLNVNTGAEVPNSRQNIALADVPADIINELKSILGEFIYENKACEPGCYCDSFGNVTTRQETFTNATISLFRDVKIGAAYTPMGSDNVDQTIEKLKSGQKPALDNATNKPVAIDPDLDRIDQTAINCCGQIIMQFDIVNEYKYDIVFDLKTNLMTEEGECRSIAGFLDGTVA